jgi:Skp family chaperone for outer membrane proteins
MRRHNMKKYLLLVLIIFGILSRIKAQETDEKIQALKVAFITQKLQLSPVEAQRFWPVYDQYQNEIRNLQLDYVNGSALENEEKLLNIRKKYEPYFQRAIGPQKASHLYNVERDFRSILIRRLQNQNDRPRQMRPLRRR